MENTTVTVSDEVWRYLHEKKERGDSMDDVLRREFGLSDEHGDEHEQIVTREPEPVEQSSDIEEMLQSWRPGRDHEERLRIKQDAIEAVEWVKDQDYDVSRSDVIAAVYEDEIDVSADAWWRKRVRRALGELAEQGVVEQDSRKWRWVG